LNDVCDDGLHSVICLFFSSLGLEFHFSTTILYNKKSKTGWHSDDPPQCIIIPSTMSRTTSSDVLYRLLFGVVLLLLISDDGNWWSRHTYRCTSASAFSFPTTTSSRGRSSRSPIHHVVTTSSPSQQQQQQQQWTLFSTTQKRTKDDVASSSSIADADAAITTPLTTAAAATTTPRRGTVVGDARGAALLLENVSVFRGPAPILRSIDWRVEPGTKWAIVGANGAGKSTLLKAIVGEVPIADGSVAIGTPLEEVGYLQQTAVAGSPRTIYEEAASGMTEVQEAAAAMQRATELQDWEALDVATARFDALGGYQQEQTVGTILKGLGFNPETLHTTKCTELSGGWQMRVAFARQLLKNPSLSLLDEPGNHLDAAARSWLARYLSDYDGSGSMILVTHDVELLRSMDHICEIIPGAAGVQIYKSCNYEQYLALKEERAAAAVTEYERNTEKAAKLQAFVDRFGASATKASAAQSRVKQLEKMQASGLLDAPPDAIVAQAFLPSMKLPSPPRAVGATLLTLQDASIGYDDGKVLVSHVDLEITKGMKLLIRGPNGAGKSTCLHALRGTLPLLSGTRVASPDLRLGMFTQDLAQELDVAARAVDLVTAYARTGLDGDITVSDQEARSAMGRLGLRGEKPLRRIGDLSGGEKARVALAMFALKPSNVYCLDEPYVKLIGLGRTTTTTFESRVSRCCYFSHFLSLFLSLDHGLL
jgi:ATP-binding cassette, subfamily F, member 3